jgi:hypothetical protein
MITPKEIKDKTERKYISFFFQSLLENKPFEKLVIRGDKSYTKSSLSEFEKEIQQIVSQSREKKGFGYTLEFQQVKTKSLGIQDLPTSIFFDTEKDFLRFLGKEKEVELFKTSVEKIIKAFPELKEWIKKFPLKVIQNANSWQELLSVCEYFRQNPNPNLYIRELPIKVHTKFIENNKGILFELLNVVLSPEYINQDFTSAKDFEKRFGLKFNQSLIRIRILDKSISDNYVAGLTDITITEEEFCSLQIPCKNVFIIENKTNFSNLMNFLTLPQMESTIGIFGSGFKVCSLKNASWLYDKEIFYWGDIDTHGLQILSQVRGYFKKTKSIMMDFETLASFKADWCKGEIAKSITPNLTTEEKKLYDFVKSENIRLEQERISFDFVIKEIMKIFEDQ